MTNNKAKLEVVEGRTNKEGDEFNALDLYDEIARSNTAMKAFGALLAGADLKMFTGETNLNIEMREGLEQIINQYLDQQGKILGDYVKRAMPSARF